MRIQFCRDLLFQKGGHPGQQFCRHGQLGTVSERAIQFRQRELAGNKQVDAVHLRFRGAPANYRALQAGGVTGAPGLGHLQRSHRPPERAEHLPELKFLLPDFQAGGLVIACQQVLDCPEAAHR